MKAICIILLAYVIIRVITDFAAKYITKKTMQNRNVMEALLRNSIENWYNSNL